MRAEKNNKLSSEQRILLIKMKNNDISFNEIHKYLIEQYGIKIHISTITQIYHREMTKLGFDSRCIKKPRIDMKLNDEQRLLLVKMREMGMTYKMIYSYFTKYCGIKICFKSISLIYFREVELLSLQRVPKFTAKTKLNKEQIDILIQLRNNGMFFTKLSNFFNTQFNIKICSKELSKLYRANNQKVNC